MQINIKSKPKKSLRENAAIILPRLFDTVVSAAQPVVRHPAKKNELHILRIKGKYLRYSMEVFDTAFGREYQNCFNKIKNFVELLGKIHDCDIALESSCDFLTEMRIYNSRARVGADLSARQKKELIVMKPLTDFVKGQRETRKKLFDKMCKILTDWSKSGFRERLLKIFLA